MTSPRPGPTTGPSAAPSPRVASRREGNRTRPSAAGVPTSRLGVVLGMTLLLLTGCAALQSFYSLARVDFELDRVSGVRLAGVSLDEVAGYQSLSLVDVMRIGTALSGGTLPLDLNLHLVADNPADNPEARLLGMDWTLFLHDRETVSGRLEREIRLPPDSRTDVAFLIELDLLEFFDGPAQDLVGLAAAITGVGDEATAVRVEILPTIDTRLGPIQYPQPIVLGGTPGGTATGNPTPPRESSE
jgi:hypothetical protein